LHKQNLYSAYEVLQAKWVLDRGEFGEGLDESLDGALDGAAGLMSLEQKFYEKNIWSAGLLPNYFLQVYQRAVEKSSAMSSRVKAEKFNHAPVLRLALAKLLDLIDGLLFGWQFLYMYPHMSREEVGWGRAFFHPRLTKKMIYKRWRQSLLLLAKQKLKNKLKEEVRKKSRENKVVLVTGVFDLLHQEHFNFLAKARQAGDILLVGVESDVRVRQLKGEGRPVNSALIRKKNLQRLGLCDLIFVLPDDFSNLAARLKLLKTIKPDILAVSSHSPFLSEKIRMMKQVGGRVVVVHQHNPAISSSKLIGQKESS
jgi:cytidyltransferase-like protein